MECRKVRNKLSPYLDRELNEKERVEITNHLEKCQECSNELVILIKQDKVLGQIKTVEPSPYFRTWFWNRVRSEGKKFIKKPRFAWFPIPAMSLLLILVIFQMSMFSFTLFAKSPDVRNRVVSQILENIVIPSNILNPVSLLKFYKGCYRTLCKSCLEQGVCSECICGSCEVSKTNEEVIR